MNNSEVNSPIQLILKSSETPGIIKKTGEGLLSSHTHSRVSERVRNSTFSRWRVSEQSFHELSHEEQFLITSAFTRTVDGISRTGRAIFLDGLGIIFPETTRDRRAELRDEKVIVRHEETYSLEFEKCRELLGFHRERFGKVMELREMSQRVLSMLPTLLQMRWSLEDVKCFLLGLIKLVKREIVEDGISLRLEKLGTFYALHNRHGYTFEDWYAGADIFFAANLKRSSELSPPREYPRPELASPFEVFEAAYGSPIIETEISLDEELRSIGISQIGNGTFGVIKLAIFEKPQENAGAIPGLVYVTDGVRGIDLITEHDTSRPKPELIVEIPGNERPLDQNGAGIPIWPARQIALGAAALAVPHGALEDLYLLDSPISVAIESKSRLQGVLVSRFQAAPLPYKISLTDQNGDLLEDEFVFMNALGITTEESQLARRTSLSHLMALLKYKGLDRLTKSNRQSILNRCEIKPTKWPEYRGSNTKRSTSSALQEEISVVHGSIAANEESLAKTHIQ